MSRRLKSKVHGIDISSNAIDVAIKNNSLTGNLVTFKNISIEEYKPKKKFDIIVSNPPYILSSESCGLDIIGAELIRDIEPGEIVIIKEDINVDRTNPITLFSKK